MEIKWHIDSNNPHTIMDEGNELIATTSSKVDARLIVRACNSYDIMLNALKEAKIRQGTRLRTIYDIAIEKAEEE